MQHVGPLVMWHALDFSIFILGCNAADEICSGTAPWAMVAVAACQSSLTALHYCDVAS